MDSQIRNKMECGNCGAEFLYATKRCPECGVVLFDENVEQEKISPHRYPVTDAPDLGLKIECVNCGSEIPYTAKKCPECGVVLHEEIEQEDSPHSITEVTDLNLKQEIIDVVNRWSSAFWRLTLPNNLFSKSLINTIIDESGNDISAVLMFGERKGKIIEAPFDHGEINNRIKDLTEESLWLYNNDKTREIPEGFQKTKLPTLYIPTGKINKCHDCRGRGRKRCSTCGGKGSVKSERDGRTVWEPCSCNGGTVECSNCDGFGWIQHVIECSTKYDVSKLGDIEYAGPVPTSSLAKTTGETLLEEVVDYPRDLLQEMLKGGINPTEYDKLQNVVKAKLHEAIKSKLAKGYEGNIQLVHEVVDKFFNETPNPVQANTLLGPYAS